MCPSVDSLSDAFHVGSGLPKNHPTYVARAADETLFRKLSQGEFCYVLTPRQMGKTSLRVRVRQRLERDGLRCVSLDLSAIGQRGATQNQWYEGILAHLETRLGLPEAAGSTRHNSKLTRIDRLRLFFSERVFPSIEGRVVLFIDEIDSVLKYPFDTDDLFEFIRFTKNEGAELEGFDRLTFALLGTATPSDLIKSRRTTPFNIGVSIDLAGFTFEQAKPLLPGLSERCSDPEQTLKAILGSTSGQPFLTQKLCKLVAEAQASGPAAKTIADLIDREIVQDWETRDHPQHLRTIRDTLTADDTTTAATLGLYRDVLQRGGVPPPEGHAKMQLVLSGIARVENGKLRSANRIYAKVFDTAWVDRTLREVRPYGAAFERWLQSERNDTSTLLQGAELEQAREWASGRALAIDDYEFLWAAEAAERKALAAASDRKLDELKQQVAAKASELKATTRTWGIRVGVIVLALALAGLLGILSYRSEATRLRKEITSAKTDLQTQQTKLAEAENRVSTAHDKGTSALKQARAALEAKKRAEASAEAATKALEAAKQAGADAQKKLDDTEKKRLQLAAEVRRNQERLRSAQVLAVQARKAQTDAETALKLAQQEREKALAEKAKAEEEARRQQEQLAITEKQIKELKERLRRVEPQSL